MREEAQYPDMTDDKVLSTLLSTSISFLEVKEPITAEKVRQWGDMLYDVYKYLVDRLGALEEARATGTPPGPQEAEETPKAAQVFHIQHVENLNINPPPG